MGSLCGLPARHPCGLVGLSGFRALRAPVSPSRRRTVFGTPCRLVGLHATRPTASLAPAWRSLGACRRTQRPHRPAAAPFFDFVLIDTDVLKRDRVALTWRSPARSAASLASSSALLWLRAHRAQRVHLRPRCARLALAGAHGGLTSPPQRASYTSCSSSSSTSRAPAWRSRGARWRARRPHRTAAADFIGFVLDFTGARVALAWR